MIFSRYNKQHLKGSSDQHYKSDIRKQILGKLYVEPMTVSQLLQPITVLDRDSTRTLLIAVRVTHLRVFPSLETVHILLNIEIVGFYIEKY